MVVTAIFVILSAVVLANNSRFGNVIVLQNLANDVALSIRQAQVYGIAVRRYEGSNFDVAYGVHFDRNTAAYQLYADASADGTYSPGETLLATTIGGGYRISDICVTPANNPTEQCGLTTLDVLFLRPEPDACINDGFDEDGDCESVNQRARITISSNRDDTAEVVVESTGQISAQ